MIICANYCWLGYKIAKNDGDEEKMIGIHNKSYDIDDEKNENKSKRNELVEYEDYLSNLPMEVEPLSKDDFYKERNNSDRGSRPFYYY